MRELKDMDKITLIKEVMSLKQTLKLLREDYSDLYTRVYQLKNGSDILDAHHSIEVVRVHKQKLLETERRKQYSFQR